MKVEQINTVCFIGAGTMGCFNALLAAIAGYRAILFDLSPKTFDAVADNFKEMSDFLVGSDFCSAGDISAALTRIILEKDLHAAVADADLVSESVPEILQLKRDVHQQLDEICPPHCILTTNTSALKVSDIEGVVKRGELFAALHSHLGSQLFDIVAGPRTSSTTVDILKRYVKSIKGYPLVLKMEHPGYVFNALMGPLLTMAKILVIEGVTDSFEDIDRAWMAHCKAPMGPFGMMDLFGMNVIIDSWQQTKSDPTIAALKGKVLAFFSPYIERDEMGMKSKKGFYSYPNPAYQQAVFINKEQDYSNLYHPLITVVIENSILIADKDVASPLQIDRAWMVGTHLDIGPFGILDAMGVDCFLMIYRVQVELGLFSEANAVVVERYLKSKIDAKELGEKSNIGFYQYPNPQYKNADFISGDL
jgi:3-hydroxybutyryl-CoA dehydrogenase